MLHRTIRRTLTHPCRKNNAPYQRYRESVAERRRSAPSPARGARGRGKPRRPRATLMRHVLVPHASRQPCRANRLCDNLSASEGAACGIYGEVDSKRSDHPPNSPRRERCRRTAQSAQSPRIAARIRVTGFCQTSPQPNNRSVGGNGITQLLNHRTCGLPRIRRLDLAACTAARSDGT